MNPTNENDLSETELNEQVDPQAQADNAETESGAGEGAAAGDPNSERPNSGAVEGSDKADPATEGSESIDEKEAAGTVGEGKQPLENAVVDEEPIKEEPVVIIPTIGRVVYLYEGGRSAKPRAAIIADALPNGRINVSGFDHDGSRIPMSNIPLVQDHQEPPATGWFAAWMPFQVGQAKLASNNSELDDLYEMIEELQEHTGL